MVSKGISTGSWTDKQREKHASLYLQLISVAHPYLKMAFPLVVLTIFSYFSITAEQRASSLTKS